MHGNTHDGMVLSGVRSLVLHMLIRLKHRVVGWANTVFASACISLICQFVLRFFICSSVQHNSKWRHVSFGMDVLRLYVVDMSYLRICFLV